MCDCQSYNRPDITGDVADVSLDYSKYFKGATSSKVSVDKCISKAMESLWAAGIETNHSCCGHNGNFGIPSVGIKNYRDIIKAGEVLSNDGRIWRVFSQIGDSGG